MCIQDVKDVDNYDKEKAKKSKVMREFSIPRLTILYTFKKMR